MIARITKSIHIGSVALRQHSRSIVFSQIKHFSDKTNDSATTESTEQIKIETDKKLGTFAKAFQEIQDMVDKPDKPSVENLPFKKLLRHSNLVDLGDPLNKIVSGKIIHTVGNDLYIDFGWKFNCVCVRPEKNGDLYVRGAKVRLAIRELELSSRFLGESKDLTILEADCALLGLISSPKTRNKTRSTDEV